MPDHLEVTATAKLFINGAFVRSESGATVPVASRGRAIVHVCRASPKDLRDAVAAARAAFPGWARRDASNRGQVLYRMAETLEGRRAAFADAIAATAPRAQPASVRREVDAAIDRLVCFAGWADKHAHVLGGRNPVAGPYYNFTDPEPVGVVGIVVPEWPALLALVSLVAPVLCAGNTAVVITPAKHPLPAVLFGEACATSDVPGGVLNVLTAGAPDLIGALATHRDVDAISAANLSEADAVVARAGAGENVKRVRVEQRGPKAWWDARVCESPWTIEPFVEMKTVWHTVGH